MRKISIMMTLAALLIVTLAGNSPQQNEKEKLPKAGSVYRYSGVDWYVRGAGNKPFDYTATGESLSLVVLGVSGAIVLVPKQGAVVHCDPTEPMIYVDRVPDADLSRNSYFKKHAKNKNWLLLELKRN